jgi:hypothetical protein
LGGVRGTIQTKTSKQIRLAVAVRWKLPELWAEFGEDPNLLTVIGSRRYLALSFPFPKRLPVAGLFKMITYA